MNADKQVDSGRDDVAKQPFIDLSDAFVVALVPLVVGTREYLPYGGGCLQGVRKRLKNDLPVPRPVAVPPQRGERTRAGTDSQTRGFRSARRRVSRRRLG